MNADAVYQLLVEANPVPDPDAVGGVPPDTALRASFEGNTVMHTIQPESLETSDSPTPSNRKWILAAAAAVVLFLAVGLFVLTRDDPTERIVPADDPPPAESIESPPDPRIEGAVDTVRTFYRAVNEADVDTVMAMSTPDFGSPEADRAMWEFNAVLLANGENREVTSCEPLELTTTSVTVGCTIVTDDPVWVAHDEASSVATARVLDDGTVKWMPYAEHDFAALAAVSEYLRGPASDDYTSACNPGLYDASTVTSNKALALTPACAEVIVAHLDDIEEWVADGKPGF